MNGNKQQTIFFRVYSKEDGFIIGHDIIHSRDALIRNEERQRRKQLAF